MRSGPVPSASRPHAAPRTCAPTTATIESVRVDTTRMHELIGPAETDWREGLRRMVEVRRPELFSD